MATIIISNGESIQSAIDKADDGDEIIVKKGVYNERLCIEKKITLRGESENRNEMPVVWNKLDDADEENTVTIVYGDDYDDYDTGENTAVILVTSECTVQNLIVRGLEEGTSHEGSFYGYDFDYNKALVLVHGDATFKNIVAQDSRFYGIVTNHENVAHFENCEVERTEGVFIGARAEGYFTNCLLHDNETNFEMHDYCYGGYLTDCKLYNPEKDNAVFYDGEISFKNCEIYGAPQSNLVFQNTPEQRYTNRQNSPWGTFSNCKIRDSKGISIRTYNNEGETYRNHGVEFRQCEISGAGTYGVSLTNFPLKFSECEFFGNANADYADSEELGEFENCKFEKGGKVYEKAKLEVLKDEDNFRMSGCWLYGLKPEFEKEAVSELSDDGYYDDEGCWYEWDEDEDDWINSWGSPNSDTKVGYLPYPLVKTKGRYDVVIPNGIKVIGKKAFFNISSVNSVEIPEGVTAIGNHAFNKCTSLKFVKLPESLKSIGDGAFFGCCALESIEIPKGVTYLGECALDRCNSLKHATIPEDYDGYLPDDCEVVRFKTSPFKIKIDENDFLVLTEYTGTDSNFVVPDGVEAIGEETFKGNTSLASVTIPGSVWYINKSAFEDCVSLFSVTIPDSVEEIGKCAFKGCENLKSVSIPKGCEISDDSFPEGCTVERYGSGFYIKNGILENYKGDSGDVVIPEGVTKIGSCVFDNNSELSSVTISASVTEIGYAAFRGCTNFQSVTIPDSVVKIGEQAFRECTNLQSVTISGNVTEIGNATFLGCESLQSVTIPDGVEKIGNKAFGVCGSLKSVAIPNSVTEIGEQAFQQCTSLQSVTIPDSVTEIGEAAFLGCENLQSVTIPDSVTEIGECAFADCENLKSVSIPKDCKYFEGEVDDDGESTDSFPEWCNVERRASSSSDTSSNASDSGSSKIKPRLFATKFRASTPQKEYYMANEDFKINNGVLEKYKGKGGDVIIPDGVRKIGECAFDGCKSLASVTIPASVTEIGRAAFRCCYSLTSVTIPDSVMQIENDVFWRCTSLASVTISKNVIKIGDDVFKGCAFAEDFKLEVAGWRFENCVAIKDDVVKYCTNEDIEKIIIPEGVTSIGERAFDGCELLASVTIPDSVTEIGENAFSYCISLEFVSIPKDCSFFEGEVDEYDEPTDSFPDTCTVERRTAPLASSSGGSSSANTSYSGGGATTYRIEVSADEAKSGCKKILKYTRKTLCNHCEGAGCASCNGAGVKDTETKLTLNIPAGTKNGTAFSSPEGDYNKSTGKKEPVVILVQVK